MVPPVPLLRTLHLKRKHWRFLKNKARNKTSYATIFEGTLWKIDLRQISSLVKYRRNKNKKRKKLYLPMCPYAKLCVCWWGWIFFKTFGDSPVRPR